MESFVEQVKGIVERMRLRADDPVFQENAARVAAETEEQRRASVETDRKLRLHQAGVPAMLWDPLKTPQPTPAMAAVEEFLESPPACAFLVLGGPAGRGKTFASCWGVDKSGGTYVMASDLVSAGTFGDGEAFWRDLEHARLVAVDELGAEYRNAAMESSFYALLNKRHANGRKTILCTNLDLGALAARYFPRADDPMRDRFKSAARWVALPGESMRKHWSEEDDES